MSKPVILTGLRANNDLHIGNYLGALLPMVDMAKQKAGEYQVNLFVPDLHSFTTPVDHSKLQQAILNNIRVYAAAGLPLDDENVHIYRQSFVPAHSELTWILDCFTGMGEMNRMTQFKDKSRFSDEKLGHMFSVFLKETEPELSKFINEASDKDYQKVEHKFFDVFNSFADYMNSKANDRASVGLFNYPVLMASDILLYNATYVPIGDDQTQHLEFTRDIAERMNGQFGELFTVPNAVKEQHKFFGKDQGLRIKDLQDPSKKMSKSDTSGKGVVFLGDSPEVARKKIMSAVTDDQNNLDNIDPVIQPGIYNLLQIASLLSSYQKEMPTIADYKGYGAVKAMLSDVIVNFLTDFQSKLAAVDDAKLLKKLEQSEKLMNEQANTTLLKVQKAVGLR